MAGWYVWHLYWYILDLSLYTDNEGFSYFLTILWVSSVITEKLICIIFLDFATSKADEFDYFPDDEYDDYYELDAVSAKVWCS